MGDLAGYAGFAGLRLRSLLRPRWWWHRGCRGYGLRGAATMVLVPWAKAGISKTPMGPFQMMVRASEISSSKRPMDLGPMSKAIWSAGKGPVPEKVSVFASGGELVGEDVIDGQEEADALGFRPCEGGFR